MDKRSVTVSWNRFEGAFGYNVKYGTQTDRLYQNYQVYRDTSIIINTLNSEIEYFFSIEAFNENGSTPGDEVIASE